MLLLLLLAGVALARKRHIMDPLAASHPGSANGTAPLSVLEWPERWRRIGRQQPAYYYIMAGGGSLGRGFFLTERFYQQKTTYGAQGRDFIKKNILAPGISRFMTIAIWTCKGGTLATYKNRRFTIGIPL